jgi:hypothetical protein
LLWLTLAGAVAAACLGVSAARATDGFAIYFQGNWLAGQTHSSAYDSTCNNTYYIWYDEFDKSSADNGRVMFIDAGGTWHHVVSGPGVISTNEPNYSSYQKKASSINYTNVGYPGTALLGYHTFICV